MIRKLPTMFPHLCSKNGFKLLMGWMRNLLKITSPHSITQKWGFWISWPQKCEEKKNLRNIGFWDAGYSWKDGNSAANVCLFWPNCSERVEVEGGFLEFWGRGEGGVQGTVVRTVTFYTITLHSDQKRKILQTKKSKR